MNQHSYLRAYMAGITVPTAFLLVVLAVFCVARFAYHVPVPIEHTIIFPMAVIPNLFGVWNMLYLRSRRRLPIGFHGALLPFLILPLGFAAASLLKVATTTPHGLVYFARVQVPYARIAMVFPIGVVIYYLVWKYLVGFFNRVLGIAG